MNALLKKKVAGPRVGEKSLLRATRAEKKISLISFFFLGHGTTSFVPHGGGSLWISRRFQQNGFTMFSHPRNSNLLLNNPSKIPFEKVHHNYYFFNFEPLLVQDGRDAPQDVPQDVPRTKKNKNKTQKKNIPYREHGRKKESV